MALEDSHLAAKGQDLGAEASLGESVDEPISRRKRTSE